MTTSDILTRARAAKDSLAVLDTARKNEALEAIAKALTDGMDRILEANRIDLEEASSSMGDVKLDRLMLNEERIRGMADGVRDVAALPDPVGRILAERTLYNGMHLKKTAVPLGVVAIIYESRPNVTSDAAALCLKSGNVCVLRGGREAYRTSGAIVSVMQDALRSLALPSEWINMIEDTTRDGAMQLMRAHGLVDLLIPRGGAGLIRSCVENATVPCIETGTGICSVYVDATADLEKAVRIIENAKTQRPSVCNAEETCLVHEAIAEAFLPMLRQRLVTDRIAAGLPPVELRLCERAGRIIEGVPACADDFDTEFLDYILAVRVVRDVQEAVEHIALHSTHHSESILTETNENADYFTSHVDSAAIYVNASTRFTDGGQFGLGCEMGISTQKLHARGPMGLEELTSYKYIITGSGQIR